MKIDTNEKIELWNYAYRLGFHAGQLDWRKQMIADYQFVQASMAGQMIAVHRNNISLEEYAQIVNAEQPELRGKL